MSREVEFGMNSGVALLRVNRPASRNALSWAAQDAFAAAVAAAGRDEIIDHVEAMTAFAEKRPPVFNRDC